MSFKDCFDAEKFKEEHQGEVVTAPTGDKLYIKGKADEEYCLNKFNETDDIEWIEMSYGSIIVASEHEDLSDEEIKNLYSIARKNNFTLN